MCKVMSTCSYRSIGGGSLSICNREYDTKSLANLLSYKESTIRRNSERYYGIKINDKWFFPPCRVIEWFVDTEEVNIRKEWVIFELQRRVVVQEQRALRYFIDRLVEYLKITRQDPIISELTDKISNSKERLLIKANNLTDWEIDEISYLVTNPKTCDKTYFCKTEFENDYRDLILTVAPGGFFKSGYLEKNESFRKLFYQYRIKY